MITSYRRVFLVSAAVLALLTVVVCSSLRHLHQTSGGQERGRAPATALQEQRQKRAGQSEAQSKSEEDRRSGRTAEEAEEESSAPLDPMLEAALEQAAEQTRRPKQRSVKSRDKLETVKARFSDALADRGNEKSALIALVREADENGKDWIRGALIKHVGSHPDPRIRRACLVCMTMFPEHAGEVFARALTSDPDRGVRALAAYALGQSGTELQVDALFRAVKEDKGIFGRGRDIANVAVSSLGEIGGERAAAALRAIWSSEELSRGCREETLGALGRAGDPAALEVLENVLRGKDELLRDDAASGLGGVGRKNRQNPEVVKRVIKVLREHLGDRNANVRTNVAGALGWVGGGEDIQLLQPLLADDHSIVVNYTEGGELKEKRVYPIREKARRAIKRIKARLAKDGKAGH